MGIAFTEYDVEKDAERMREFKELGGKGYPLLIIGGDQKMHGFDQAQFQRLYQRQSE